MNPPTPRPRRSQPKRTVSIIGTGSYVPERILTNADLAKLVETSDEWIISRTGIRERRIAADDEATSDLATKAALAAMENAGITAGDIFSLVTKLQLGHERTGRIARVRTCRGCEGVAVFAA